MSEYLTAKEISETTGIDIRVIRDAFRTGALKGRNFKGPRGWMTTKTEVDRWITGETSQENS